jgi:hypothetical protein
MALRREKCSNAGKAPQRLDKGILSTLPHSGQSKPSKKASLRSREASIASQALKSSKKTAAPPAKRLVLSVKPQATQASIQPASLRREEDISTALESPEPLLDLDDGSKAAQEDIARQEEEEAASEEELREKENTEIEEASEEEMVVFETYTIELSVNLGKKAIYNCPIKSTKLNLKHFELDARQRASEAADRAKKNAEFCSFKASIKKGAQKPFLYTLNDGGDMSAVESRVQELLAALKSSSQASLRVAVVANFDAVAARGAGRASPKRSTFFLIQYTVAAWQR